MNSLATYPCVMFEPTPALDQADLLQGGSSPLEDRHWPFLRELLARYPHPLSGYSLASLVAWHGLFDYRILIVDPELVLISCVLPSGKDRHLLQPVGRLTGAMESRLVDAAQALPYALRLVGVDRSFVERHPWFTSHFAVISDAANFNYLYDVAALASLAGRRYAKKRNLIAQATRAFQWTVEAVSGRNAEDCRRVAAEQQQETLVSRGLSFRQDDQALEAILQHFEALQQHGILIRVQGEPVAFSLFEEQSPGMVVVHFERALRRFKGLYQLLNQALAQTVQERGYAYLNREEDLGDDGLRQAKRSYHPIRLVEALNLVAHTNGLSRPSLAKNGRDCTPIPG